MSDLTPDALRHLEAILDVIPSPVLVKDEESRIVLINDAACALFGKSRDVILHFRSSDLMPADYAAVYETIDAQVLATGEPHENEEAILGADDEVRHAITRKRRATIGGRHYIVAVITDVTAMREAQAHNRYLAFHDAMTGLPNRMLLGERIDQALLRAARRPGTAALLYIDLDRFKEVNDTLGHAAGDEVLIGFGRRLSSLARASDTVARLGGDEFAVLLHDIDDNFEADTICRRILAAAEEAFVVSGGTAYVGASMGLVMLDDASVGREELQRRADLALYDAKNTGRGCFQQYSAPLDARVRHRLRIDADLREALATGRGLEVHYQPVVEGPEARLKSLEALVRWRHPELGMIGPGEFVRAAEESGIIVSLGEWVLKEAVTTVAQWPDVAIAVNVSPVQLRSEGVVARMLAIIDQSGIARERVQIEVTESTVLDVGEGAAAKLRALRKAGVRIVLDDFGTGYSSLAHLQRLEIDRVKIDQSFVARLAASPDARAIIQAVLGLGRSLGIAVTAEGVETDDQRQFLRAFGCTEFQGYLFSRPLPREAIETYLAEAIGDLGTRAA